ncbi:MAG TPA: glycosyltransferase family 2 protein [Deinococcales bacterium]|nr:glycosyltransferase family 2 protein [Deinococcales bacterium]
MLRELSVVVPSYNSRELLRKALALLTGAAPEAEAIVVDGSSTDGSADMTEAEFPGVRVLRVPNHGWAHATNRGFETTRGRYLLTMNSDLFITRAALEGMVRALTDARVGAAGPTLLNEDGTRQQAFGPLYWPNWLPARAARSVPLVHGSCLMTRRDVLEKVGGLDENFFFYNEEFDWCWRLKRSGYARVQVPETAVHLGGGSTPPSPRFQVEGWRGSLHLVRKHAPAPVTTAIRTLALGLAAAAARLEKRPENQAAWHEVARIARTGDTLKSPFPLSGRGEWHPRAG